MEDLSLSQEEFNSILFNTKQIFEIDYEEAEFLLQTEIGSNIWYAEPYDPDAERILIYDVNNNINLIPFTFNHITISESQFNLFRAMEEGERI